VCLLLRSALSGLSIILSPYPSVSKKHHVLHPYRITVSYVLVFRFFDIHSTVLIFRNSGVIDWYIQNHDVVILLLPMARQP
jgi:hypothetical protein